MDIEEEIEDIMKPKTWKLKDSVYQALLKEKEELAFKSSKMKGLVREIEIIDTERKLLKHKMWQKIHRVHPEIPDDENLELDWELDGVSVKLIKEQKRNFDSLLKKIFDRD